MEYYAKSNDTKKEVKNVNDIRNILIYLLDNQMDKLNENESKMIISYLDSLKQQTVQEQKTLREHEKDIVNCAGKFFEIFDMYFTEKEKNLVLEACRVHDLGKANYIFKQLSIPDLQGWQKVRYHMVSLVHLVYQRNRLSRKYLDVQTMTFLCC